MTNRNKLVEMKDATEMIVPNLFTL